MFLRNLYADTECPGENMWQRKTVQLMIQTRKSSSSKRNIPVIYFFQISFPKVFSHLGVIDVKVWHFKTRDFGLLSRSKLKHQSIYIEKLQKSFTHILNLGSRSASWVHCALKLFITPQLNASYFWGMTFISLITINERSIEEMRKKLFKVVLKLWERNKG